MDTSPCRRGCTPTERAGVGRVVEAIEKAHLQAAVRELTEAVEGFVQIVQAVLCGEDQIGLGPMESDRNFPSCHIRRLFDPPPVERIVGKRECAERGVFKISRNGVHVVVPHVQDEQAACAVVVRGASHRPCASRSGRAGAFGQRGPVNQVRGRGRPGTPASEPPPALIGKIDGLEASASSCS